MIFNSVAFLIFFAFFFPTYWWINDRYSIRYRNLFTILLSYLFYGWWDWRFLSLIILSSTVDYGIGLLLSKTKQTNRRKQLLGLSLTTNLGILGFFKYFNFFIDSFKSLLTLVSIDLSVSTLEILLPVGISFYTFQTLSYTIDIYKKELKAIQDPYAFFAFVSFFPQLVAGPIERASHLLRQFTEKKIFDYGNTIAGLRLVLWGMFKKIVIADNFGYLADRMFDPSLESSGVLTIFGAFCFTIQIYADFSGYSDMAIGLSRMLGIKLKKNFKTPYFAQSLRTFWHRWHISLSTWFRDYVYIPLGGNKGNVLRVNFNIFLTFLLSGLWHGAKITFVIWGALHGLFLIVERLWKTKLPKYISTIFTFIIVLFLWIPFRAESTNHLISLLDSIIDFKTYSLATLSDIIIDFSSIKFISLAIIFQIFWFLESRLKEVDFSEWIGVKNKMFRIGIYYIIIIMILFLGNFNIKPQFIYFQF